MQGPGINDPKFTSSDILSHLIAHTGTHPSSKT